MKIRTCFVSNSSSSSFVVAFDRIPTSIEDMKQILFNDSETYGSPYGDDSWPTIRIAEIVYNDLCSQLNPLNYDEIVEALDDMIYIDYWNDKAGSKYKDGQGNVNYDLVDEDSKKLSRDAADKFISQNKGKYYYQFEYADENGSLGSAMEHGDLFSQVAHITMSRH